MSSLKSEIVFIDSLKKILLISVFIGLNKNNKLKFNNIKQDLIEFFIRDIDHSLRLEGISDLKIGKIVKLYVKKFYYRLKILDNILNENSYINFNEYLQNFDILNSGDVNKITNLIPSRAAAFLILSKAS